MDDLELNDLDGMHIEGDEELDEDGLPKKAKPLSDDDDDLIDDDTKDDEEEDDSDDDN